MTTLFDKIKITPDRKCCTAIDLFSHSDEDVLSMYDKFTSQTIGIHG